MLHIIIIIIIDISIYIYCICCIYCSSRVVVHRLDCYSSTLTHPYTHMHTDTRPPANTPPQTHSRLLSLNCALISSSKLFVVDRVVETFIQNREFTLYLFKIVFDPIYSSGRLYFLLRLRRANSHLFILLQTLPYFYNHHFPTISTQKMLFAYRRNSSMSWSQMALFVSITSFSFLFSQF